MSSPRVSVVIPCYNLGRYLEEAVESVLGQTFRDFEIIIVNDGSTDPETTRLLADYRRPRTRVVSTANRGLAAARNLAIDQAAGAYICALDADDRLHPRFLEKTVAVLDRDPGVTFVSTRLQMFGEEDRMWPSVDRCDLLTLLCEDTVITAAPVRRAAVLAAGGYDENMPAQGDEDWDLWISLVEAGHIGVTLPEVLFFYRRRPGSMCTECTRGQTHLDLMRYIVHKHLQSYRAHLVDVLLSKEREISRLRRVNVRLESELATYLVPTVDRRRDELQGLRGTLEGARRQSAADGGGATALALRSRLEQLEGQLTALRVAYEQRLRNLEAMRASGSWRITAPLRALYDLSLRSRSRWTV